MTETIHPLMQDISKQRYDVGFGHKLGYEVLQTATAPGPLRILLPDRIGGNDRVVETAPVKVLRTDPRTDDSEMHMVRLGFWVVAPRGNYGDLQWHDVLVADSGEVHAITDMKVVNRSEGFTNIIGSFSLAGYFVDRAFLGQAEESALSALSPEDQEQHRLAEQGTVKNPKIGYQIPPAVIFGQDFKHRPYLAKDSTCLRIPSSE